jgi:hypothetical protein
MAANRPGAAKFRSWRNVYVSGSQAREEVGHRQERRADEREHMDGRAGDTGNDILNGGAGADNIVG